MLLPEVVEWRPLGSVIDRLRTGLNPRSNFALNAPGASNYYVTVRELAGLDIAVNSKTDLVDDAGLRAISNRAQLKAGDVLFSGTGTIGRTALVKEAPKNWGIKEGVYALTPKSSEIDSKFLIYVLGSRKVRDEIAARTDGSTVVSVSMANLRQVLVPVPSLEVQREIVGILDNFTELDAELEAELEARRRQWHHYKKIVLTPAASFEATTVGEVCEVFGGAPFKSEYFNKNRNGVPVVRIRDINTGFSETYYSGLYKESYRVRDGDILIGMDGDFRTIRWSSGDAVLNQRVSRLQRFDPRAEPGFVFHVVREALVEIQAQTQGSTVAHLSAKQIRAIAVPLYPLEEQRRRAAILDKFDALVNDLSIGLPAELAARRKQFEYYRDKLLTFEEAPA